MLYSTMVFFPIDIDECTDENNPCDHTCTNTDGSFKCGCNEGYRLVNNTQCVGMLQ